MGAGVRSEETQRIGDVVGDILSYLDTSFWPIIPIVGVPVALVILVMRRPAGTRIWPRDEPTSLARPGSPLQEAERASRVQERGDSLGARARLRTGTWHPIPH
jgi:hypothetical protein